jgi:hypothetical protein
VSWSGILARATSRSRRRGTDRRRADGFHSVGSWSTPGRSERRVPEIARYERKDVVLGGGGAVGAIGLGFATAQNPLVGVGVAALIVLFLIPWGAVFTLLVLSSVVTRFRFQVGPATVQLAHLVIIPLAVRTLLLTKRRYQVRWEWPEIVVLAFIGLQFVTSYLNAQNVKQSIFSAGLLGLGALAYLTTYSGLNTRARLLFGARVLLIAGTLSAVVALLAAVSHSLFGTAFGVGQGKAAGAAFGLSHEHDIQGSIAGATAIAFLVLSREGNPLFRGWVCTILFAVNLAALLVSLTRSAWIGFSVAAIAMLLMRRPPRMGFGARMARVAFICLMLGVGLTGILTQIATNGPASAANPIVSRGSELTNFSTGTGAHRLTEWQIAIAEALPRSPLIGLGTNSYGQRNAALTSSTQPGATPVPGYVGNLYVRTLYDSGLIGFGLLVAFYFFLLRPGGLLRRSEGDLAPVALAVVFGYWVIAIGFAATDASFTILPWIWLGVIRAAKAFADRQAALRRARAPEPSYVPALVARSGRIPPPPRSRSRPRP